MSSSRWNRIEQLFREASALPPEEREAYLEEHCDDDELRQEVLSLLKTDDEASEYFDYLSSVISPAREEIRPAEGEQDAYESDPLNLEGMQVGRYEVEACIGGGGMGVVYRARDSELDRQVALKFLSPLLSRDQEARERFLKEARAVARLNHANICTIHDFHEQEGRPVLVMEYIEGETLRERLREGPLPADEALEYAANIAKALSKAHEAGVVHRDVKPGNIMITAGGQVKVMDFGLAKLKGADPITETGSTVGTMAYMAPEQIQGRKVDQRADMFAFAVVLFEMLTGIRPFRGENMAALTYSIVHEEPDSVRSYLSEAPEAFERFFEQALAKQPEQRFNSATDMVHDLQTLDGKGDFIAASPRSVPTGAPVAAETDEDRRGSSTTFSLTLPGVDVGEIVLGGRRLLVGTVGVLAVALFVGWWLAGSNADDDRVAMQGLDPDRVAIFPFTVSGDEELQYLGESMVELLGRTLDGAGPIQAVDHNAILSRMANDTSSQVIGPAEAGEIAASFNAGRFVLGSIVRIGDEIRIRATWYGADDGEHGSAEVSADGEAEITSGIDALARRAISELVGGQDVGRIRLAAQTTTSAEALKTYLEGQAAFRRSDFEGAMKAFQRAVDEDSAFALAHYRLNLAAGWIGEEGSIPMRTVLELAGDLPERDRRLIQARHATLEGRADEAERLYRVILDGYPNDVEAWNGLSEVLVHFNAVRGRPAAEARDGLETALQVNPSNSEPLMHLIQIASHERDEVALDSLTSGLEHHRLAPDFETAFQLVRASLLDEGPDFEMRERLLQAGSYAIWTAGYILHSGSYFQEAETVLRPLTHPDRNKEVRARARIWLARMLVAQGRLEAAREEVKAVASLDRAEYLTNRALLATLPFVPGDGIGQEERQPLLERLFAWNDRAVPERLTYWLHPAEIYHIDRLYLIGLLHAAEGDSGEALEVASQLENLKAPEGLSSGPSDLARAVEAEVERRYGQRDVALSHLETLEYRSNPILVWIRIHSGARERYLRAELLVDSERFEEALAWYETLGGIAQGDLAYVAPAHLGRGQVLEELDRPEEAAEAYERFLELWDDADAVFQPKVEDARDRLTRLSEANSNSAFIRSG